MRLLPAFTLFHRTAFAEMKAGARWQSREMRTESKDE
jgi:hypothetical protein